MKQKETERAEGGKMGEIEKAMLVSDLKMALKSIECYGQPAHVGFAQLEDEDLLKQASAATGRALKAIRGFRRGAR